MTPMKLTVFAIASRQPAWVNDGVVEFLKRFPRGWSVDFVDLPLGNRGSGDTGRAIANEGARLLDRVGDRQVLVALDERGKSMPTKKLASVLSEWSQDGRDIAFAIGGPDGHAAAVIERADHVLSLSAMTLPHGLVRVMLAEQLYRCWSILNQHPYHRE